MGSIPEGHVPPANTKALALIGAAICLPMVAAIVIAVVLHDNKQRASLAAPVDNSTRELGDLHQGWLELGALAAKDPPPVITATAQADPGARGGIEIHEPSAPATEGSTQTSPDAAAPGGRAIEGSQPAQSDASTGTVSGVARLAASPPAVDAGRPAAAEPAGVPCGTAVCPSGKVCCNASCGTCTDPGQKCSQLVCGMNVSTESVACGSNTCNVGQVCCNASCGTCTQPGQTCSKAPCDNGIQFPASPPCGMSTCNVGMVCCNPSCGICAPPGEACSQQPCG